LNKEADRNHFRTHPRFTLKTITSKNKFHSK